MLKLRARNLRAKSRVHIEVGENWKRIENKMREYVDFQFSEEQNRFRHKVCIFLDTELISGWVDREDGWQVFKDMARKLGEKGWLFLF